MLACAIVTIILGVGLIACEREQRRFRESPPAVSPRTPVMQGTLQPGSPAPPVEVRNVYEENAFAVSEGQRLYEWFNCTGCHARRRQHWPGAHG